MDNVKYEYQKLFEDLYYVYESTLDARNPDGIRFVLKFQNGGKEFIRSCLNKMRVLLKL